MQQKCALYNARAAELEQQLTTMAPLPYWKIWRVDPSKCQSGYEISDEINRLERHIYRITCTIVANNEPFSCTQELTDELLQYTKDDALREIVWRTVNEFARAVCDGTATRPEARERNMGESTLLTVPCWHCDRLVSVVYACETKWEDALCVAQTA